MAGTIAPKALTIFMCPVCGGDITRGNRAALVCRVCMSTYPMYRGIPDFRYGRSGFRSSEEEQRRVRLLLDAFERLDFQGLLRLRFGFSRENMPDHLWQVHLQHEHKYAQKGRSRRYRIEAVLAQGGKTMPTLQTFLDVGCGTGTALPWLMEGCTYGIGVDISLVDLLIGKKFYEEQGITHIGLVCAFAERLPFRDETFDMINATDVIEHVIDGQEAFVREMYRVLIAGGVGYFNSPNRYNLFGPEPHVRVWFVGFLPRCWMDAYVRRVRGVRYTSVRLLSYGELSRLLAKVCGTHYTITGPILDPHAPATSRKARLVKACPFVLSLVNRVLFSFTTDYQVVISKPAPSRTSHAAIRTGDAFLAADPSSRNI